jgi:hypothetical protein
MKTRRSHRSPVLLLCVVTAFLGGAAADVLGVCGPFTDVTDAAFCPFVLEIFTLGITTGTTPTTYDPAASVSRLQMAAFLSRSVDKTLKRGSRRAALNQFWRPQGPVPLALTAVGPDAAHLQSDGTDLWVARVFGDAIARVRTSDGKLLETWTGADAAQGVLVAPGRVFATGTQNPGKLYMVDPAQAAGVVTTIATPGAFPAGITFDGVRIWTANQEGSVSIVTPGGPAPWTVTTVTAGLAGAVGALYDGANVWVTDHLFGALLKLNGSGGILQTVTVGSSPQQPVFDGDNIWVPNNGSDSVTVVRASSGAVLRTLTGNGLDAPLTAAFDGERVLVTNQAGDSVSLWKAADLTPLGTLPTGNATGPFGACSDGLTFWVSLNATGRLIRF